jgi:hypothetical protein
LALSAALYLAGLSCSAAFWHLTLRLSGEHPSVFASLRAYFTGHLGKYMPGKGWALLVRTALIRGAGVRLGPALWTSLYELATTMAAGALVAAAIFAILPVNLPQLRWNPTLAGMVLLVVLAAPLWPGVFQRLVQRVGERLNVPEQERPMPFHPATLLAGLALTSAGRVLLGVSMWALLYGILPEPPPLTPERLAHYVATMALAYVVGFLAVVMPNGIVVREYFLLELLAEEGPSQWIALGVLLLRLVWTVAELAAAGVLLLAAALRQHINIINNTTT